eukprot:jgi/Mesen1/7233/ME000372S06467
MTEFDSGVSHVFIYGQSRPDVSLKDDQLVHQRDVIGTTKAYLLGSRLYSYDRDGKKRAAVRLEEPGHAVKGFALRVQPGGLDRVISCVETLEGPPGLYEKDTVHVMTETGERVKALILHRQDVNRSQPVSDGDWKKLRS